MSQGKTDNEQGYLPTSLSALMDTWKEAVRGEADDDLIRVPVADMRAMLDALLASGVVQVTTPTETDDNGLLIEVAQQGLPEGTTLAALIEHHRAQAATAAAFDALAPVVSQGDTPADEEWEDPEPYVSAFPPIERTAKPNAWSKWYKPRTREQYEADQKPVAPVDALGFPTEVGATFRARFAGNPEDYTPHHFRVSEPGRFWLYSVGNYRRYHLNPASIEDVRPADGRSGQ